MDISIIIVTWNSANTISRCIESILHSESKSKYEIIVVDNASKDNTVEIVNKNYPEVHLIRNPSNYGFARAVNIGYRESSGKYVMSLNPDAEVLRETIDTIVGFMDTQPEVGLLAPGIIESRLGEGIHLLVHENSFRMPPLSFFSIILKKKKEKKDYYRHKNAQNVFVYGQYVEGPCIVARRSALNAKIFFREDTFLYNEEFPLCEDVRRKGYKVGVLSSALVRHIGSTSYLASYDQTFIVRLEAIRGWYQLHRGKGYPIKRLALLQLADATVTFMAVWLMGKVRRTESQAREAALAYHRSRMVGFFWIIFNPKKLEIITREGIRNILGGEW